VKCPKCQGTCSCVDSRPALLYGGLEVDDKRTLVRERKYTCRKCQAAYLTQELLARSYPMVSRPAPAGRPKQKRGWEDGQ